jgi:hypothetical protein
LDPILDPILAAKDSFRDAVDHAGRAGVRLAGSLGVVLQQGRGIMPAPSRNDVYGHATVQQQGFMGTPEIVKAQVEKANPRGLAVENLGDAYG